ncbi:hypothetical protein D3C76_793820 [compost metagenome]
MCDDSFTKGRSEEIAAQQDGKRWEHHEQRQRISDTLEHLGLDHFDPTIGCVIDVSQRMLDVRVELPGQCDDLTELPQRVEMLATRGQGDQPGANTRLGNQRDAFEQVVMQLSRAHLLQILVAANQNAVRRSGRIHPVICIRLFEVAKDVSPQDRTAID